MVYNQIIEEFTPKTIETNQQVVTETYIFIT